MKKLMVLFGLVVVAFAAIAATPALADSPHFIGTPKASVDSSGNLVCSFKEAGLGTISATNVSCSATATAVYQCWNNGGNHPKAGNKETVTEPVTGSGTFPVRNGQTTGSMTVAPPGPGSFSCPPGQTLYLESVTYSGITLTAEAGTVNLGTASSGTLHIPV